MKRDLITLLPLLLCASCITSPEVREGDAAFERGDHIKARLKYKEALHHGLRDADESARVEGRLAQAEASLQADADAALAQLNAADADAFDEAARESIQTLAREPCDVAKLSKLRVWVADTERSLQVRRDAALAFSRCALELTKDLEDLEVFALGLHALETLAAFDASAAEDFDRALSKNLVTLIEAQRTGAKSKGDPAKVLRVLAVTQERWSALSGAAQISSARDGLTLRVLDAGKRRTDVLTCEALIAARVPGAAARTRTLEVCARAVASELDALARPGALADPVAAFDRLTTLASLPMNTEQFARVEAHFATLSSPWRARAAGARNGYARSFYLAIADRVDGRSTAKVDKLFDVARQFVVPSIGFSNGSSDACSARAQKMYDEMKIEARGASVEAAVISIDITACKTTFDTSYTTLSSRDIRTNEVCKEITTYKRELGQKCVGGNVTTSEGTRYDSCKAKVSYDRQKPVKTTRCTSEADVQIRERARVCFEQRLSGSAEVRVGGRSVKRNAPQSESFYECADFEYTYYQSQGRPDVEPKNGPAVRSRMFATRDAFMATLSSGLASRARTARDDLYRRRLDDARTEADRLARSSNQDARIEGIIRGLVLDHARANPGGAPDKVALPAELLALAPDPGWLRRFTKGHSPTAWARTSPEATLVDVTQQTAETFARHVDEVDGLFAKDRGDFARQKNELAQKRMREVEVETEYGRPRSSGWLSTGRLVSPSRGPAFVWTDRTGPSDWAMSATASVGQQLLGRGAELDAMWGVGLTLGPLHLGGGGRTALGSTRGGQLSARWLAGPAPGDAPLDPGVVWSAGLQLDWTPLGGATAFGLRAPVEWSLPVLEWLSVDAAIEFGLLHLATLAGVDPGLDARAGSSGAWVGATASLWQGRVAFHARVGPSLSTSSFTLAAWRTDLQVRF